MSAAIENLRGIIRDYDAAVRELDELRARLKAITFTAARLQLAVPEILASKLPAGDRRLLESANDGVIGIDQEGFVRIAILGCPLLSPDTLNLL